MTKTSAPRTAATMATATSRRWCVTTAIRAPKTLATQRTDASPRQSRMEQSAEAGCVLAASASKSNATVPRTATTATIARSTFAITACANTRRSKTARPVRMAAGACQAGSCVGVTAWTVRRIAAPRPPLYGVSFTDANNGTVVGRYGTILRTTDGGATWVEQDSGTTNDLKGVSFTDANTGTVVVGFNETILRTTDGGATWVEQDSGIPWGRVEFTGVSFTDAFVGLADGWHVIVDVYGGAILQTTDGGDDVGVQGQRHHKRAQRACRLPVANTGTA